MVHHIEAGSTINEVLKSDKLVVVDFFATWCGPCQMLAPVLEKVEKQYREQIEVYKVNIDESLDIAMRYDIVSVPTIIFFKNGNEIERQVGFVEESEFGKIIEDLTKK